MPTVSDTLHLRAQSRPLMNVEPGVPKERVQEAASAVELIPPEDKALLESQGLTVDLRNIARAGKGDILGTTTVVSGPPHGRWRPTAITVAGDPGKGMPVGFTLLHEVGHAVSVLRHQDRSEDAADEYAYEKIFAADDAREAAGLPPLDLFGEGATEEAAPAQPKPAQPQSAQPKPAPAAKPPPSQSSWTAGAAIAALLGLALLVL